MSATGNFGGASSMGGGGNMSNQEWRGSGGLLGYDIASQFGGAPSGQGAPMWPGGIHLSKDKLEEAREYIARIGFNSILPERGSGQGGGAGNGAIGDRDRRRPRQEPPAWVFPQYTQSWLPPTPPVPPRIPTPPFVR